jgi:hypothetical protein
VSAMRWVPRLYLERVPQPQKLLLRDLSALMLSALLYLGAAIALSGYRFLAFVSRGAQITRGDLPPICGVIFFGGIAGPILMFLGLQRFSAR